MILLLLHLHPEGGGDEPGDEHVEIEAEATGRGGLAGNAEPVGQPAMITQSRPAQPTASSTIVPGSLPTAGSRSPGLLDVHAERLVAFPREAVVGLHVLRSDGHLSGFSNGRRGTRTPNPLGVNEVL